MNLRQVYLDARDYVLEYGFSPDLGEHGAPRCFVGALESVGNISGGLYGAPLGEVLPITNGLRVSAGILEREGWTAEDAAAAFEIAADLAA